MKVALLTALLVVPAAHAATITTNCTATIQSVGACGAGDAGEAGVLIAYWASSIDDAPGDAEVAANSVDLRDAVCANFGIAPASCTAAAADGALRRFLEGLVKSHRLRKKTLGIAAPATPLIDAQANP